ncbi:MAG: Gfo/Idh/MocA family oxidoreductase [Pirellulales bacterium]|nr:Gfo/Idh/MocA family oxidoreductase [Pirellulales bacterium]
MPTGFGVIGCGVIARFHARAIADTAGARLIGCWDHKFANAQKFAAESNCAAYEGLDQLLADPRISVVVVGTPSGAHAEPAVAAARTGKHVLVEKPLEITLKRCDAIIRACADNAVKLATIFPSRFHAVARELRRAVLAKRFGRITLADAYVKWFRSQEYYDSGRWRGTWELDGGGALMNQGIHSVDLLLWVMGDVASVTAQWGMLAHQRIAVEDTVVATLRFTNGSLGVIEAGTAVYPGFVKRIDICGSQGTAVMEEESLRVWEFAKAHKEDAAIREKFALQTSGGGASDPKAIGHHAHALQFADFLAAIKRDRPPKAGGAEGRRAVEVILAIYQAAESGKVVKLPLTTDPRLRARRGSVK